MSVRLPAVKPKEVLRALRRAGFFIHHTSGSHHVLKHPDRPHLRVTIPFHGKDLKRRTLASIIEQAELTTEEFRALL
jgi:predicted RNA binding protein YcfA (HicA-like mRNA interferase family)